MPEIQAFRALRYDLGHVGSLGDVVAPPYDVIGPDLQEQLYRKHPCNVVRLILNRIEPGDDDEVNNRYTRAEPLPEGLAVRRRAVHRVRPGHLRLSPGVHLRGRGLHAPRLHGPAAAVAVRRRPGLPARGDAVRTEGRPADADHASARRTSARSSACTPTRANQAQQILDAAIARLTPLVATDHLGVVNRLWPVTDVSAIAAIAGLIGPRPIFIADGHHRYETACNYRDHVHQTGGLDARASGQLRADDVRGHGRPGPDRAADASALPRPAGHDAAASWPPGWATVSPRGRPAKGPTPPATFGTTSPPAATRAPSACSRRRTSSGRWPRLTDAGRARMADVAKDHTEPWRALGVSILHRLLVENLLGGAKLPKPKYVHLVEEVVAGLRTGEFPLAALVMPATVEDIRTISSSGERMPAKSTYFYPKLLSGLVINPLE